METSKNNYDLKDIDAYLLRIERSYRNLLQFKEKMNSYLCEPCTANQYEAREKIHQKMIKLTQGHLELMKIFRNKRNDLSNELMTIRNHLNEVRRLEEGICNYMLEVQH
ncbi:MAG: hypothetical protein WBB27_04845 [Maribacter sp.]